MKNISRLAEARITEVAEKWFAKTCGTADQYMIESLKKIMREEFCHGLIEGHNIATAKAAIASKRNEETISEVQDATEGRR